jgi:hypothetical protein
MPLIVPDTSNVPLALEVRDSGVAVGSPRGVLNLIDGSNVTMAVAENAAANRVDVTVNTVGTNYAAAVLALGPASYYHVDETSGTAAADVQSVVGGTYVGGPALGQPSLISSGGTSVLIGASQAIDLGSTAYRFAGTAPFTVMAWVQRTLVDGTQSPNMLFHCVSGASGEGWRLSMTNYLSGAQDLLFGRYVANTATDAGTSTRPIVADTRNFIAGTYDGVNSRVYLNGVLVGTSATDTRTAVGSTGKLYIGNNEAYVGVPALNRALFGYVDEPAILTRAMTGTELLNIYQAGV